MVAAWGIVFAALLWWLPPTCRKFPVGAKAQVLDVSADGRYAVLGDPGNLAASYENPVVIDLSTGAVRQMPLPIIGSARILGRRVWLGSPLFSGFPRPVSQFNLELGEMEEGGFLEDQDGLRPVQFSQDGSRAAVINPDASEKIVIWDIEARKVLTSIEGAGDKHCLSDDGTLLAVYSTEPRLNLRVRDARWRIYDAGTGTLRAESLGTVKEGALPVSWLRFADEQSTLLAHGRHENPDGYWTIWNWKAGLSTRFAGSSPQIERWREFQAGLGSDVGIHAKTRDDAWAVTTSSDRTLWSMIVDSIDRWFPGTIAKGSLEAGVTRLWNVRTGQVALTLAARSIPIHLSESGNCLLRIRNGHLEVWTNPSPRPWGLALLGSLVVPAIWAWRKFRARAAQAAGEADGNPPGNGSSS